jgi:hypothetical protein
MKAPAPAPARIAAAKRLRDEIDRAEAEGVLREDMILRLTFGDVAELKRDASLALEDISFTGGVMRFLGVRIKPGGVVESVVERPAGAR